MQFRAPGTNAWYWVILDWGFMLIYLFECLLRFCNEGRHYWRSGWNWSARVWPLAWGASVSGDCVRPRVFTLQRLERRQHWQSETGGGTSRHDSAGPAS